MLRLQMCFQMTGWLGITSYHSWFILLLFLSRNTKVCYPLFSLLSSLVACFLRKSLARMQITMLNTAASRRSCMSRTMVNALQHPSCISLLVLKETKSTSSVVLVKYKIQGKDATFAKSNISFLDVWFSPYFYYFKNNLNFHLTFAHPND